MGEVEQMQTAVATAVREGELEPAAIARAVGELDDETLRELLGGEVAGAAIDEIVRRFPEYVEAERCPEEEVTVAWVITDGARRERFAVGFARERVRAGRELAGTPRVTLELELLDFLRLVTGNADPATLFLGGRLALSGDERFALEMASFLSIPGAGGRAPGGEAIDPVRVDPVAVAGAVASAPEDALRAGMSGGIREPILDEIFRRLPDYAQPDRLEGVDAVIGFKVTGRADGGADRYRVVIRDGRISVGGEAVPDPQLTVVCDGANFLKLVTGNLNPVTGFVTGKLRIRGDLGLAARLPGLFRIPSPAAAR